MCRYRADYLNVDTVVTYLPPTITFCLANVKFGYGETLFCLQKARLLSYHNHASYVLDTRMAKTPERVTAFLYDLQTKVAPLMEDDKKLFLQYKREDVSPLFYLRRCQYRTNILRKVTFSSRPATTTVTPCCKSDNRRFAPVRLPGLVGLRFCGGQVSSGEVSGKTEARRLSAG